MTTAKTTATATAARACVQGAWAWSIAQSPAPWPRWHGGHGPHAADACMHTRGGTKIMRTRTTGGAILPPLPPTASFATRRTRSPRHGRSCEDVYARAPGTGACSMARVRQPGIWRPRAQRLQVHAGRARAARSERHHPPLAWPQGVGRGLGAGVGTAARTCVQARGA